MRAGARAVGVLALVLAACGTTTHAGPTSGGPTQSGLAATGPVPGTDTVPRGATPAGSAVVGSGSASSGGSGALTGGEEGSTPSPAEQASAVLGGGAAGSNSRGVTATTIYVGIPYTTTGDALNSANGAGAITTGNQQADANAIIADINKSGGIAGRKLAPVFANFDSLSTQTVDQQWARICATFTQDNHVFAMLGQSTPAGRACFQKAGVAVLDEDLPTAGRAEFATDPSFIELGYPNLDRIAAEVPASLADQGYFKPWNTTAGTPGVGPSKVGVMTYNTGPFKEAVDSALVPALTRLGYKPDVEYSGEAQTAGDYGSVAAAVSSAELKFRSEGVDHVIMFDSNGGLGLFFMNAANGQGYYPRYGGHTGSGFEALLSTGVSAKNMRGAMGFGWSPMLDLQASDNPDSGPYSNDARRHCVSVFRAAGITFSSTNAESIGESYCDSLFLLRDALDKTPSVLNAATFVSAVEGLGSSFPSTGLGEVFGPGRHDGQAKAYWWEFQIGCACFRYTGPLRTIP